VGRGTLRHLGNMYPANSAICIWLRFRPEPDASTSRLEPNLSSVAAQYGGVIGPHYAATKAGGETININLGLYMS
jgi:hypothetical protein